ncbi:MAG: hypothetical protein WBM90_03170 [Acidimicrobiia bacterium]
MTTTNLVLDDWATKPLGRAARIAIAVGGMITATLVLLMATMLQQGTWMFTLLGVSLVATSVRAARFPTILRLGIVAANLIVIPYVAQTL